MKSGYLHVTLPCALAARRWLFSLLLWRFFSFGRQVKVTIKSSNVRSGSGRHHSSFLDPCWLEPLRFWSFEPNSGRFHSDPNSSISSVAHVQLISPPCEAARCAAFLPALLSHQQNPNSRWILWAVGYAVSTPTATPNASALARRLLSASARGAAAMLVLPCLTWRPPSVSLTPHTSCSRATATFVACICGSPARAGTAQSL